MYTRYGEFEDNFDEALSEPDEAGDTHGDGNDDDGDVGDDTNSDEDDDDEHATELGEDKCTRKRVQEGDDGVDHDMHSSNEAGTAHPDVQQPRKMPRSE